MTWWTVVLLVVDGLLLLAAIGAAGSAKDAAADVKQAQEDLRVQTRSLLRQIDGIAASQVAASKTFETAIAAAKTIATLPEQIAARRRKGPAA